MTQPRTVSTVLKTEWATGPIPLPARTGYIRGHRRPSGDIVSPQRAVTSDHATPRCCTGPVIHVPRLAVPV